ncbi:MAG: hypothetical protein ACRC6E_09890 [Fusobacteriaceae bacterium]
MAEITKTLSLTKPLKNERYDVDIFNINMDTIDKLYSNTIEELKLKELKIGDIVQVFGYYKKGDGARHLRKIEATDDGSGELLANGLFANIVHNGEINIGWFGAKGDGITDDDVIVQKSINYCNTITDFKVLHFNGIYKVYSTIMLSGNIKITGGGTFLFFDKAIGDKHFLFATNTGDYRLVNGLKVYKTVNNVHMENIKIDYKNQLNKGGRAEDNFLLTCVKPEIKGAKAIFYNCTNQSSIKNCTINDCYGDGIRVSTSCFVHVTGNSLISCGASNIVSGETGYDNNGDGISAFYSRFIFVNNNYVKNERKFLNADTFGGNLVIAEGKTLLDYHCARSGLEFEYNVKSNSVTIEQFLEEKNTTGEVLLFKNNFVEGYAKGIHNESNVECLVDGNKLYNNYIHMMISSKQNNIVNNYMNDERQLMWLQSGYHEYHNSLVISNYDRLFGISNISNNSFLNGAGVVYDSGHVNVTGNKFEGFGSAAKPVDSSLTRGIKLNLVFRDNICIDSTIWLFSYSRALIEGNTFLNSLKPVGRVFDQNNIIADNLVIKINSPLSDTNISKNTFIGSTVFADNVNNLNLNDNLFLNNDNPALEMKSCSNTSISNNVFNFTDMAIFQSYGQTSGATVDRNTFRRIESRTDITNQIISCPNGINRSIFSKNRIFSTSASDVFITNGWTHAGSSVKNNYNEMMTVGLKLLSIKSTITKSFRSENIGFEDLDTSTVINTLDTPYYTLKMQQEGIYEYYITYRDELHIYEQSQQQEASTLLLEPVVPQSIIEFATKYNLI